MHDNYETQFHSLFWNHCSIKTEPPHKIKAGLNKWHKQNSVQVWNACNRLQRTDSFPSVDHSYKLCSPSAVCMFVWLTYFPHGPSGSRREWPLQTPPRHPPFPVGRKRWRKLNHKDSLPFPLYSMCNLHCNRNMMSLPHGAKHSMLKPQWYPKVLSEQNHTTLYMQWD